MCKFKDLQVGDHVWLFKQNPGPMFFRGDLPERKEDRDNFFGKYLAETEVVKVGNKYLYLPEEINGAPVEQALRFDRTSGEEVPVTVAEGYQLFTSFDDAVTHLYKRRLLFDAQQKIDKLWRLSLIDSVSLENLKLICGVLENSCGR